ncbi:MAG: ABC transporter permease [Oscillospiraceae bacterium]|nr:ABC transporter permease [Oscillospiraceae bacterium]
MAVFKRELKAYFITPLGYAFIGVYLVFSGAFFYMFTLTSSTSSTYSFSQGTGSADFAPMFSLMFFVLMFTVPLLTMRLFAEERRAKTDQLLLTAPLGLFELVAAKFAAAYAVFLISTAVMPIYGIVLSNFTEVSWRTITGNMFGLIMVGAVFTASGLLVSSLTENQMIAAILGVFVNVGFLFSSVAAPYVEIKFISDALRSVSLLSRYDRFTIGLFEPQNVLFFLSIIAIFLFLTVRGLERRRWL